VNDTVETLVTAVDSLRIDPGSNDYVNSLKQMKERLAFDKSESHITEMISAIPEGGYNICRHKFTYPCNMLLLKLVNLDFFN